MMFLPTGRSFCCYVAIAAGKDVLAGREGGPPTNRHSPFGQFSPGRADSEATDTRSDLKETRRESSVGMTTASVARIGFRLAIVIGLCVAAFYLGRPLYWKLSATMQEIREKDYTHEAVKKGFSELMAEAQRSVGWGPGATISEYEEERALMKAQQKKEIDKAKPNIKKGKDKKKDSLRGRESNAVIFSRK
ncbi:hypothetical protein R1flu_017045 [Riccia fluitans]|uniref:Uncharacterized protein n=1 Tax=Riccia fluitans TaxID=41844 RepID=A0ABD1YNJ7_9MARC